MAEQSIEFRYDTQLLVEGESLDPDKMTEYMLNVIPSQVEAYYRASQDFVGLKDSGKPKNAYLRKLKENKENEVKLKAQKTKSTFKRASLKLEEKEKYALRKAKEEYENEIINTNMPNE